MGNDENKGESEEISQLKLKMKKMENELRNYNEIKTSLKKRNAN